MITKSEWSEWRQNKVTLRLLELVQLGKEAAIEELVQNRKSVGDFQRGAVFSYDDVSERVLRGDNMYTEGE